jgi:hypothetical protein
VTVSGEGGEAGRDHYCLVDRRLVAVLELAQERPGGDARVPARLLPRDHNGQLKRVGEVERRQLLRRRFDDEQVPMLEGQLEDRVRTALRG